MTANETDPVTGTRSTRPEAPAEAASDAPTGNPGQPHPTLPEGMGDLDQRAIDTVRVLAMDAVQKVGNGHPGTAMSLAPIGYLLFQRWLRHDPSDPQWTGRDRFVLSMGHSSLTLYIQLFFSGYGLELSDLEALRTWGSLTPGHPEVNHTPGVETTTGPLGQGVGNAVGMAMAARRERGMLDPDAPEGESVFDHTIWAFASDGDLEEGISGEASSLAGTQELGNLVLVYDANRISIEDDTDIAFTEDVGKRYEAYGWHVQHVHDGEDLAGVDRALAAAKAETGRPSMIVLRTIIGWPSPNKQNTGAAHGSALGEDEVRATKVILGFDPDTTFNVAPEVLEHARRVGERGEQAHAQWQRRFDAWRAENPDGAALLERMSTRTLPEGWADKLPTVWLDDLSRDRIRSGNLQSLVDDHSVVGVTTNPTIFAAAISGSESYDDQVHAMAVRKVSVEEALRTIIAADVRDACDLLAPVAQRTGRDGRVSLEVSPGVAHDTDATAAEAAHLWWLVNRTNLFIKIPATQEGLAARARRRRVAGTGGRSRCGCTAGGSGTAACRSRACR